MPRGKYIVIEGSDGTGKSTQVMLLRQKLSGQGVDSIEFHEPGGVPIADDIRTVIKNGQLARDPATNLLLFTAARHEIWKNARKQLENGTWIVAARNYFSTLAFQGYGEGVDLQLITDTTKQFTDEVYMQPDIAVILSLDDEAERLKRIAERGELIAPDTFESQNEAFQQTVKEGYLQIAKSYDLPVISAAASPEDISQEIYSLVSGRYLA